MTTEVTLITRPGNTLEYCFNAKLHHGHALHLVRHQAGQNAHAAMTFRELSLPPKQRMLEKRLGMSLYKVVSNLICEAPPPPIEPINQYLESIVVHQDKIEVKFREGLKVKYLDSAVLYNLHEHFGHLDYHVES